MNKIAFFLFIIISFSACSGSNDLSDAYGNFEATEVIVSAENSGELIKFEVENGQKLKKGQQVGLIDTTIVSLKLKQLLAAKKEVAINTKDIISQIAVLKEQKSVLLVEKNRIERLLLDSAATTKQHDDIVGKIKIIDKRINLVRIKNGTVLSKLEQVSAQIDEIKEQISKCRIINPINGTVLQKYAEESELAVLGKSLYTIANISKLELKVYISGAQLPQLKLGQEVTVIVDKNADENTKLKGTISWISSTAEFTPKIIQTKEERVKLVYAMKVLVNNNGSLKIGMPGEIRFN